MRFSGIKNTILAAVALSLPLVACHKEQKISPGDDVLIAMGDSVLRRSEVVARIPVGIAPEDSAALFRRIVNNWVETMVLTDFATRRLPNLDEIEDQVAAYRNRLIVSSYLKQMRDTRQETVNQDSVKAFYNAHKGEMVVERPLVKGIYMKVSDDAPNLAKMRHSVFDASDESIDNLEKNWIADAIQYDYFADEWIDWEVVADEIPYRFFDVDAFLESTKNFETSSNGSTYLLHISQYLPTGSQMPFEFAAKRISAMFLERKKSQYEDNLVRQLVKNAIERKQLVAVGYNPLN